MILFNDDKTGLKVQSELTMDGDEYLLVKLRDERCEISPQDALILAARIASHCAGLIP